MPDRPAASLTRSDACMGRTVTLTGRLVGVLNIGRRMHVTVEIDADQPMQVAPKQ
jgi:hypothetical protein